MIDELEKGEKYSLQLAVGPEYRSYKEVIEGYLERNKEYFINNGCLVYVGSTDVEYERFLTHELEILKPNLLIEVGKHLEAREVCSTHGLEERLTSALFLVAETNIKGLFVILADEPRIWEKMF